MFIQPVEVFAKVARGTSLHFHSREHDVTLGDVIPWDRGRDDLLARFMSDERARVCAAPEPALLARPFVFCTRITTCYVYPDRAANVPHFVPGLPHVTYTLIEL